MAQPTIVVDGATRPCLGETANGDAWQVDWRDGACRIAVIDALGHGPGAAEVADQARLALQGTHSMAPDESLGGLHRNPPPVHARSARRAGGTPRVAPPSDAATCRNYWR